MKEMYMILKQMKMFNSLLVKEMQIKLQTEERAFYPPCEQKSEHFDNILSQETSLHRVLFGEMWKMTWLCLLKGLNTMTNPVAKDIPIKPDCSFNT